MSDTGRTLAQAHARWVKAKQAVDAHVQVHESPLVRQHRAYCSACHELRQAEADLLAVTAHRVVR
jgi:hypothetical protein